MQKTSIPIFLFIILLSSALYSEPKSHEKMWGTEYISFIKKIPADRKYREFKPSDRPGYSNRIINFLKSIDPGVKNDLKILRIPGKPATDYLFMKNRLYSVTENWGIVDKSLAEKILQSLLKKYKKPVKKEKGTLSIYTFVKGRTKIILYQKPQDNFTVKVRLYTYSMDLFSSMFAR